MHRLRDVGETRHFRHLRGLVELDRHVEKRLLLRGVVLTHGLFESAGRKHPVGCARGALVDGPERVVERGLMLRVELFRVPVQCGGRPGGVGLCLGARGGDLSGPFDGVVEIVADLALGDHRAFERERARALEREARAGCNGGVFERIFIVEDERAPRLGEEARSDRATDGTGDAESRDERARRDVGRDGGGRRNALVGAAPLFGLRRVDERRDRLGLDVAAAVRLARQLVDLRADAGLARGVDELGALSDDRFAERLCLVDEARRALLLVVALHLLGLRALQPVGVHLALGHAVVGGLENLARFRID